MSNQNPNDVAMGYAVIYSNSLDGLARQELLRHVKINQAADAILTGFTGTTGNRLPLRIRRHIAPQLRIACARMASGEVIAVEVINLRFGNVALRGAYSEINNDITFLGKVIWLTIRADGKTRLDEFCANDRLRDRVRRAWHQWWMEADDVRQ